MHKRKTQRWNAGLQGDFNFMHSPSSLTTHTTQAVVCGYRVDSQVSVSPIWRRIHE